MNKAIYDSLTPKEKLFADLLFEIYEMLQGIIAIDAEKYDE